LKYRKKSFERLMAISEYYFHCLKKLAKAKCTLEIKYLAVVESALNKKQFLNGNYWIYVSNR
jgi:membrane-bound lytic murein transglycosylase D